MNRAINFQTQKHEKMEIENATENHNLIPSRSFPKKQNYGLDIKT